MMFIYKNHEYKHMTGEVNPLGTTSGPSRYQRCELLLQGRAKQARALPHLHSHAAASRHVSVYGYSTPPC